MASTRPWTFSDQSLRTWARRGPGRRASDHRQPTLESLLGAVSVLAWAWSAYEVVRLFAR